MVTPPPSIPILLGRADALAGRSLQWLANREHVPVPPDLRKDKGWIGQLLERALGATAGSRAEPDFPELGVEMKTLPVDQSGRPKESTYVCTAPLDGTLAARWQDSWACRKLSTVLWIPIIGDGPPGTRIIGSPLLWSPTPTETRILAEDYAALVESIDLGETWQLLGRKGKALQLRPKAANAAEMTWVLDEDAEWTQVNPRGFYLRASFTSGILSQHFHH